MTRAKLSASDRFLPIPPTSPDGVLEELRRRGYDDAAALSYAAAARSWTDPGSPERSVWNAVEEVLRRRLP